VGYLTLRTQITTIIIIINIKDTRAVFNKTNVSLQSLAMQTCNQIIENFTRTRTETRTLNRLSIKT